MKITLEQRITIYKAMDVLVNIGSEAWNEVKSKDFDLKCKEAELHETADKAWWTLQEMWKFFD